MLRSATLHYIEPHSTTSTATTTLRYATLHYTTLHKLHYTTLHYTALTTATTTATTTTATNYTTLRYTTLHYNHTITTLLYATPQLQLQLQLHLRYTNYTALRYSYNSTTLQLQLQLRYTTLHPAVVGEVTTATIAAAPKKHSSNHLSVHQRVRSAIHASQQFTSPTAHSVIYLKLPPPPCAALLVYVYTLYI